MRLKNLQQNGSLLLLFQKRKRKNKRLHSTLGANLFRASFPRKNRPDEPAPYCTQNQKQQQQKIATDSYSFFKNERRDNSLQEPVNHGVLPSHDVAEALCNTKLTDKQTATIKQERLPILVN
jgi:hypothetical protein